MPPLRGTTLATSPSTPGVACLMVVLHHSGFALTGADATGPSTGSWARWFVVWLVRQMDLGVPLFFMRASEDNSIGTLGNVVLDENFKDATSPVWRANVLDAGHWSFTDICGIVPDFHAGCGADTRQTNGAKFDYVDIEKARAIARAYTTAFFASTLTGDATATDYLATSRPAEIVTVTHRN